MSAGHRPGEPSVEVYPSHEDFSVRTAGVVGLDSRYPRSGYRRSQPSRLARSNCFSGVHGVAQVHHVGHRTPRWFQKVLRFMKSAKGGWGADVSLLYEMPAGALPPPVP